MTVGVLAGLTEEQLASGFQQLAEETAREIASVLRRDLYRVR